jgi:disulfide bond formation protein DsbB
VAERRLANLAGALACVAMMGYALYAEWVLGFEPCPLCVFQRVGVVMLGAVFLAAAAHAPTTIGWQRFFFWLFGVAAIFPLYVSGRHVYIQSLPEGAVPACGASLDYMFDVLPLATVLTKVLFGAGECQKIDWTFIGLSMPAWVFLCALALTVLGVWVNLPRRNKLTFR